jgi:hypothetical protein
MELDDDEVELSKWTGELRESDDEFFLSVHRNSDDSTQSMRYYWARIETDGDLARAWIPGFDVFKKLVEEGVLQGQIDNGAYEVTLTDLEADDVRSLSSKTLPTLPVIFRRIGR